MYREVGTMIEGYDDIATNMIVTVRRRLDTESFPKGTTCVENESYNLITMMHHMEFADYNDLGPYIKGVEACLRDEPDGTGSKTRYTSGDIEIEISRTPSRIVVHYRDDQEDFMEFMEFLIIPSMKLYTIRVNDNTPTFKQFDQPFSILEFCLTMAAQLGFRENLEQDDS